MASSVEGTGNDHGAKGASTSEAAHEVGVGPHPQPWPDDARFDRELLRDGDRRNVVDKYRYWTREAIVADLDRRRHPFHVAIENWEHDMNIGTVVRNANAFLAAEVHIVGKKRWNRRGAMVTDRYQHIRHHQHVDELVAFARDRELAVVGVDNLPGAVPIETVDLPEKCILVLGQEGPGLSDTVRNAVDLVVSISQFGSTRSINAGVASGIAMHTWIRQHGAVAAAQVDEQEVIAALGLEPLPEEGGWFRETHRDEHSTAILYFLGRDDVSRMHRIDATELWHHHAGAPVELLVIDDTGPRTITLGSGMKFGQQPQAMVPRGAWQGAVACGGWALVSTTVAPPFEFEGFDLAEQAELIAAFPEVADAIRRRGEP